MVYYINPEIRCGLDSVNALSDGSTINIGWFQAYPTITTNKIAYNIYYSAIKENVFSDGIKFVSIDTSLEANIIDLSPGQLYWFSVRPVEYNSLALVNNLPIAYDNLRVLPFSILRSDISSTDLIIPLDDIIGFPSSGVIKIGIELIHYTSIDIVNSNLIVTDISGRGYNNTVARSHTVNGFDGINTYSSNVSYYIIGESNVFDHVYSGKCRFEYPNNPFTLVDGYQQVTADVLTTDLSASDEMNVGFPMYDYAGYHRVDPVKMLTGECVGLYFGGQLGCVDGYGNFNIVRGISVQDRNNQRQEIDLSLTGRPAILIKRVRTGITCACYNQSSEYPDDRCPLCNGGKFVLSYEQYFNPRRSDGRIMVRVQPTDENLKMTEAGFESEFPIGFWTMTVPTIKTKDIVVLFDIEGNEEFRYEIMSVTRNNTLVGMQGGQLLKAVRIRKTDPAYQIRIFRDSSMFPSKLLTSVGMAIPGVPPHTHELVISEKILSITQINQTTSISNGHSHAIISGVVMPSLNHTHTITL